MLPACFRVEAGDCRQLDPSLLSVFQAMLRLSLAARGADAISTRLRPDCLARYKAWSAACITSSTARMRALGSATPILTVTEISELGVSSLGRVGRVLFLGAIARRASARRSELRRSWPRKSWAWVS